MQVLMSIMDDVKPGDTLDVSYLRNDVANVATVTTDKLPDARAIFFDKELKGNYDIDIEVLDDVLDLTNDNLLIALL